MSIQKKRVSQRLINEQRQNFRVNITMEDWIFLNFLRINGLTIVRGCTNMDGAVKNVCIQRFGSTLTCVRSQNFFTFLMLCFELSKCTLFFVVYIWVFNVLSTCLHAFPLSKKLSLGLSHDLVSALTARPGIAPQEFIPKLFPSFAISKPNEILRLKL